MKSINEIEVLFLNYNEILSCKRRIPVVENHLSEELLNLKESEKLMNSELLDVIKLQSATIKYLFLFTLRNYEEQVKKENQEYLKAVLNYNETLKIVDLLKYELDIMREKVKNEAFVKQDLERKLTNVESEILANHSSYMADYKLYTEELNHLIKMKIEIEEATEMVKILKDCFDDLVGNLEKAKEYDGWGEFYAEKQMGKKLKVEFIDKADIQIIQLEKALISLKEELTDVKEIKEIFKRSEVLVRGFNLKYYDGLIEDWIKDLNLTKTLSLSVHRARSMDNLVGILDKLKHNTEKEYALHDERRKLLLKGIGKLG